MWRSKAVRPALKLDLGKTEFSKETKTFKTYQSVTAPVAASGLEYEPGEGGTGEAQKLLSSPAIVMRGNDAEGAVQYSLDGTNWSTEIPTATNPGDYSVYYKVEGNDGFYAYECAEPLIVTMDKAAPATPTAIAVYGQTLADAILIPAEGWSWVDSPSTSVGNAGMNAFLANYKSSDEYVKDMTNVSVDIRVLKADQAAPAAPTLSGSTASSITLATIENGEYRLGNGNWQDSPTFEGLDPATEHTFYQRLKEDDNHNASSSSAGAPFKTLKADQAAPAAPTAQEVTTDSITLATIENGEYKLGDGDWQDSPAFTGLEPNTGYTFSQRLKEDDTHNISPSSEAATISTAKTADQRAASDAGDAINALPNTDAVTTADEEAIRAAREAYNALTDEQKALVSPEAVKKLEDAEKALGTAKEEAAKKKAAEEEAAAMAKGKDGTPVGEGAGEKAADQAITNLATDADPKGSQFEKLMLKSTKQTANSITLAWNKASGAKTYVVYGNACGKKNKMKKLATTSKNSFTVKKISKTLKKGTYHKFTVVALDKNKKVVSTSTIVHVATKGNKKSANPTGLIIKAKVNKNGKALKKYAATSAIALKKGKSTTLKTTIKKAKKTTVKNHRKVAYASSNKKIATVTKSGKIKAVKKGKCTIYAYAQNGTVKTVKVTVK